MKLRTLDLDKFGAFDKFAPEFRRTRGFTSSTGRTRRESRRRSPLSARCSTAFRNARPYAFASPARSCGSAPRLSTATGLRSSSGVGRGARTRCRTTAAPPCRTKRSRHFSARSARTPFVAPSASMPRRCEMAARQCSAPTETWGRRFSRRPRASAISLMCANRSRPKADGDVRGSKSGSSAVLPGARAPYRGAQSHRGEGVAGRRMAAHQRRDRWARRKARFDPRRTTRRARPSGRGSAAFVGRRPFSGRLRRPSVVLPFLRTCPISRRGRRMPLTRLSRRPEQPRRRPSARAPRRGVRRGRRPHRRRQGLARRGRGDRGSLWKERRLRQRTAGLAEGSGRGRRFGGFTRTTRPVARADRRRRAGVAPPDRRRACGVARAPW